MTQSAEETEIGPATRAAPWWRYPRFGGKAVKVLLVSLRHLLLREIYGALRGLGHDCRVLVIEQDELERGRVERMYTEALRTFRPDFVLTVNHLGFDHEGVVTELLSTYEIPFASWYVDSPHLIIRRHRENNSPYLTLWLWDKDYIGIVRGLGVNQVEYLPLGVDETLFYPLNRSRGPSSGLIPACPPVPRVGVSFVGNSMVLKVRSKLSRSGAAGPLKERFNTVAQAFEDSPGLIVREMVKDRFPELAGELERMSEPRCLDYETAVIWKATGRYRLDRVKMLKAFSPVIVGDPGWKEILGSGFRVTGVLNYYDDLPGFYNHSPINFNATSRQMKKGVNQRVFDVPACGRVLVTDWTEQLEALMEPDKEIIAYRDREEIPEKVERLIRDKRFRNQVAEAGRRRVLDQHTYRHRLSRMVDGMRARYG